MLDLDLIVSVPEFIYLFSFKTLSSRRAAIVNDVMAYTINDDNITKTCLFKYIEKGIFHFCPRMDFSETLYNNN